MARNVAWSIEMESVAGAGRGANVDDHQSEVSLALKSYPPCRLPNGFARGALSIFFQSS
jgi:hypothetical protein